MKRRVPDHIGKVALPAAASRVRATWALRELTFKKLPIELALAKLLDAQAAGATHVVLRVRWER